MKKIQSKGPRHHSMSGLNREQGFTFIELAFAVVILAVLSFAMIQHLTGVYRRNSTQKEKVFAFSKATAILAELQTYVNASEDKAADSLDALDDGTSYNPILSIAKKSGVPILPDHPLSGNFQRNGAWVWARRITVKPFAGLNNRNVRYVTVRIYKSRGNGKYVTMADLAGVVNSVGDAYPPSQVYDIYLLALENVPGWWVFMDAIRPFVESTITDLEARNPGVKFRTHWITKAAYGRNQLYTPYVNEVEDSVHPIPNTYFYPGKMPSGSASNYYYVPDAIGARILLDGTLKNGYDASDNPLPYALADRFNQAMRLPDERKLFDDRVTKGLEDPLTPTWRLLLEDMASNPDKFKNSILINLHGELLPMPALRNYSDPAKSPLTMPGLRVVTHPEKLRHVRGSTVGTSENLHFRVYAYRTDPNNPGDSFTQGEPITLQVMGVDLTGNVNGGGTGPSTLQIQRLAGGVDTGDGDLTYKPFADAPTSPSGIRPLEMYYQVSFVDNTASGGEKYTLIKLYNTPSVTPQFGTIPDDKGLYASHRLYGLDYIPCSTESSNDFSTTLASSGAIEKNTARWRITIPKEVLDSSLATGWDLEDHTVEVRTRIGEDLATGTVYPSPYQPDNLSKTYTWWVLDPESVPFTERAQFIGDPRHCPYADLKNGGGTFADGYNWYFDNFSEGSKNGQSRWPGFDTNRLRDRWRGRIEADFPRYAQLLRTALAKTNSLYTTLTGFSYYYMGLGNEIGYDSANGYSNSIPVHKGPFGGTGTGYVDNIAGGGSSSLRYQKIVREGGSNPNYWWGMYWLGELYPDSAASTWLNSGNLPAGNGSGSFYRDQRYDINVRLPYGTRLHNSQRRTATEGCTSVFNIGTSGSTFHHQFASGTNGTLVGAGNELAQNYNFPLPTTTKISRPFSVAISYSGGVGDEWGYTSAYPRFSAGIEKTYYQHSGGNQGSALVGLNLPDGSGTAHIVVNGLDRTTESGSAFIAKYSILSLLHSFFEAGNSTITNGVILPPRVELVSPTDITELNNPSSIPVTWSVSWKRWDGIKYTSSFSSSFSLPESNLQYVVMYSDDGGRTFKYMQDDSLATPGTKPTNTLYLVDDVATGDETYNWPTPASKFPAGSYLLLVECYRKNATLHYSYHKTKIYIQR